MKIKKDTFQFLSDLKENNDRTWFQENKERYDLSRENFKDFVQELIIDLSTFDPHINTEIDVSKCLFRIYRDVRFSKNKAPYKSWFAAGISVDGRKLEGPEYYFHAEPGRCFIAVGYWRPKKDHLEAIRQEIDYSADQLHSALKSGGWVAENLDKEDKLVRPPKGYDPEDPNIELLKLKSFILYQEIDYKDLFKDDGYRSVVYFCQRAIPFKNFLHEAINI